MTRFSVKIIWFKPCSKVLEMLKFVTKIALEYIYVPYSKICCVTQMPWSRHASNGFSSRTAVEPSATASMLGGSAKRRFTGLESLITGFFVSFEWSRNILRSFLDRIWPRSNEIQCELWNFDYWLGNSQLSWPKLAKSLFNCNSILQHLGLLYDLLYNNIYLCKIRKKK